MGETGVAKTPIDEKGKVFIHGEIWDACSTGEEIEEGSPVRVQGVKGLLLVVEQEESKK